MSTYKKRKFKKIENWICTAQEIKNSEYFYRISYTDILNAME